MEQLQEALWANSKVVKNCGPSGTAKTTLVHRFISWTPQRNRDSSIRDAPPTSELHACALDTGAAWTLQRVSLQSGFDEEVSHASCLTCSNSCVVDELSRFQPCEFDCIVQLWTLGERTTGLFLVGNRWQQASFGEHRAWHSNTWKCSLKCEFHDSHPCKCPARTGHLF